MSTPIWDQVPAARIDEALYTTFGQQLETDGFTRIARRLWARSRVSEIVDLFHIQAIKGVSLTPRWGFSLTYVPHVKSNRLSWHRTLKSAQFDVVEDPLDLTLPESAPSLLLDCSRGETVLRTQASALCPFAVAQADRLWERASGIDGLRSVLLDLKARTSVRFEFYNYVAHPIALAFTLARLGDAGAAQAELSRYTCFEEGTPQLREALLRALGEASKQRGA